MASVQAPNEIILFHYPFSPYARRIVWYLTLRNIPYAQCLQPHVLPRPDLSALGIAYRRIPLLSIGNDVYADTRLILAKLESLFPASAEHPALSSEQSKPLEPLLASFVIDGGVFARAASLIPTHLPVMKDPKFAKDRDDFSGRKGAFSAEVMERGRPESLAYMRIIFDTLETLLADGRQWIAGGDKVSRADLEAVWPLDWMNELGSLPKELFGESKYPKTQAWAARFKATVKEAAKKHPQGGKAVKVSGDQAFEIITSSKTRDSVHVDAEDPLKLKEGQNVSVFPTDTGSAHKDHGRLIGLTKDEVAILVQTKKDSGKELRLHAPRWGFRVLSAKEQSKI